jgi:cardiolipin synthase
MFSKNHSRKPATKPSKPRRRILPQLTAHENIYTVPNILTFSRLIAAPVIGYLVLHDYHAWAVGLFAYAGITDLVDGYIARRWKLQTVVGTVIDPMADKTLMTVLTVCLAIKGALPGLNSPFRQLFPSPSLAHG